MCIQRILKCRNSIEILEKGHGISNGQFYTSTFFAGDVI